LDKGRGYVATVLVQNGTLKGGDLVVSGQHFGRVKAMFNERNKKKDEAPPSAPVLILGLNGAPQAGEKFKVYEDEAEAKEIAYRRAQILRSKVSEPKNILRLMRSVVVWPLVISKN
jgi:translation initiation factor IF-2